MKSIELAPPDVRVNGKDTTAAELEIEPEFAPINSDARAIVRQKTLQGEAYVELTPGTEPVEASRRGAARSRSARRRTSPTPRPRPRSRSRRAASLGIGAVEEATQFDEILNAFDEETRETTQRA